jgi:1-deoxy-D-xylulose-5-phosphate synthase
MLDLARKVSKACTGVDVVVARSIKPLDNKLLDTINTSLIITLEENSVYGGFGSIVREYYASNSKVKVVALGVKDEFILHGSIDNQLEENGLTVENIESVINANKVVR